MSALEVLAFEVCLVFCLHAAEVADWGAQEQAARAALQQHDYNAAIELFGKCVTLAGTPSEHLISLSSYGIALNQANRNREAKTALEHALSEWSTPDDGKLVASGVLASVDRSLGDYEGAENVLRAALEDRSANPKERAILMVNLTDLLREEGREQEARATLDEAGELKGLPPRQQTNILVENAELTRELRLWDASVALWNRVGEIAESEHSRELEVAYTGGLGETWLSAGDLTRAEPLLRRSLQLLREDHSSYSQIAVALALLARVYILENKLALAGEALDEALSKDADNLGPGHPQMAMLFELRGDLLSRRGEAAEARKDLEKARGIMSNHFGPHSTAVAGVIAGLGDVELRSRRPDAAVSQYELALQYLREAGADGAQYCPAVLARYVTALKAAHRGDEAKSLLATGAARSLR